MSELKIQQFFRYAFPAYTSKSRLRCPDWPADMFAIAASLLERSGGYTELGSTCFPYRFMGVDSEDEREIQIENLALQWRSAIMDQLVVSGIDNKPEQSRAKWTSPIQVPSQIGSWFETIIQHKKSLVSEIRLNEPLLACLVNLLAVSDETLSQVGVRTHSTSIRDNEKAFWRYCGNLLFPHPENGSTLCREIDHSRIRVLPKSQMPVGGLSLRSLSQYLAMCPPVDLPVFWYSKDFLDEAIADDHCNVMVVPWPYSISPIQFAPVDDNRPMSSPKARRFEFIHEDESEDPTRICNEIEALLDSAMNQVGRVHVVVLPELSISPATYDLLVDSLQKHKIILIAGVSETFQPEGIGGPSQPRNVAKTCVPTQNPQGYVVYEQHKHHRWKLDADQIVRYGLAGRLDPKFDWWEHIELGRRQLNFMRPKSWLSICVLLCEDLAQTDPVGRFVRAIAPDLVVSLLMDGPQLKSRWPARYATVLADDPGSAVLTLTSLGMNNLSKVRDSVGQPVPRTIALWKDPLEGTVQIDLPKDKTAAIITIRNIDDDDRVVEWTADGRGNSKKFGTPAFGGVHFV